jgi:hypothetical protein
MLNEVLISGVKLARDYDQCKMQAHSAYMQGNEEQASSLYHAAFGINKALMSHYPIASVSLIRCVHACLDCLDFCNRENDQAPLYYLKETEALLAGIIEGSHFHCVEFKSAEFKSAYVADVSGDAVRHEALLAYAELIKATIGFRHESCCNDAGMKVLMFRLEKLWKNNSNLINTQ